MRHVFFPSAISTATLGMVRAPNAELTEDNLAALQQIREMLR
jgi:hypothetical protein